ncbi:MAG TPA: hypothetical protein GX509_11865 [Firmicutes bacterium]|nr:hypothetical protein [Bacillota bacterium]HHY99421.1 hypothetical protein [Bacillota bacterium]
MRDLASALDNLLLQLCEMIETILVIKEGMGYAHPPDSSGKDGSFAAHRDKGPERDSTIVPQRIRWALVDLAEYGFVVLESEDDADQVQAGYPLQTDKIRLSHGWCVREKMSEAIDISTPPIG